MRLARAFVLSCVLASSAYAGDWTGAYVGVNGGWANANFDHTYHTNGHYNLAPGETFDYDDDGGILGGHAGYNWQMGQLVLGIEAGIAKSWLKKSDPLSPFFPGIDHWTSEVEWMGSVTPRLGVAIEPDLLAYVKGGWAFGRVRDYVEDDLDFVSHSATANGWTIGGGFEFMLAPDVVVGAEYDYYDLGSERVDKDRTFFAGGTASGTDHDFDVTVHAVTARLSYKFGVPLP